MISILTFAAALPPQVDVVEGGSVVRAAQIDHNYGMVGQLNTDVVLSACYRRQRTDSVRLTYIIYCLPLWKPFPVSCDASPSSSAALCYGMLPRQRL